MLIFNNFIGPSGIIMASNSYQWFFSYSYSVKRYSYSMAVRYAAMLNVDRSDRGGTSADRDAREILKGSTRGCVVTPDAAIVATRRDALAVRCE